MRSACCGSILGWSRQLTCRRPWQLTGSFHFVPIGLDNEFVPHKGLYLFPGRDFAPQEFGCCFDCRAVAWRGVPQIDSPPAETGIDRTGCGGFLQSITRCHFPELAKGSLLPLHQDYSVGIFVVQNKLSCAGGRIFQMVIQLPGTGRESSGAIFAEPGVAMVILSIIIHI